MNNVFKFFRILVVCLLACLLAAPRMVSAASATITVDTSVDSNDPTFQACTTAPNDCSLRGSISLANANPSTAYTILVPAGTYTLSIAGADENNNATGDLDIRVSVTLQGSGMNTTILQGGPSKGEGIDRVLEIVTYDTITVQISKLTFQNGEIKDNECGGGLSIPNNFASVSLTQVTFKDNIGEGYSYGAGLFTDAYTQVMDCTFIGNETTGEGGGIYQGSNNSLHLSSSTLMNNSALYGGGLSNQGTTVLTNVTISGNTATGQGGGISQWNNGDLTIHYTTITNNSSTSSGSAVYNARVFKAYNSIITAPSGKIACFQAMDAGNYNLSSDDSCGMGILIADPLLGVLQDNGGYTWTHALLTLSPAIDTADPSNCVSEDQRAKPRPVDGDGDGTPACDVGAYEMSLTQIFLPLIGK